VKSCHAISGPQTVSIGAATNGDFTQKFLDNCAVRSMDPRDLTDEKDGTN
jgi:hypothetical protein